MWFKDGSRVEVLRKRNGAYGSWFPVKIVSKTGWFVYTVRYELYLTKKGEAVEEDVHERDIRPCPPIVGGGENWVLGDVAEVFDLRSWRVGRIVKVLDKNYFVIRLLGSDELKKFHVSNLRVRQAWHNDRWMLLEKVSEKKGNNFISKYPTYMDSEAADAKEGNDNISKFPTYMDSQADEFICEKGRTKQNPSQGYTCPFRPPRPMNKHLNSHENSFPNDAAVRGKIVKRRLTPEPPLKRAIPRKLEALPLTLQIVEENIECSVASCSGDDSPKHVVQNIDIIKHSRGGSDGSFDDDTTSSCAPKNPKNGKSTTNVHELELHAYKSTVQALYVSGPLSWEQESLLTNLRMSLHISNEEHLLQLKNLLSA